MGVTRFGRNALASSARPIEAAEFVNALSNVLKLSNSHNGKHNGALGLAISGGVDSMALAALCSRAQKSSDESHSHLLKPFRTLEFQAFVVDHGVRSGSDVEAASVSKVLEKRGIQTQVLKIDWQGHDEPGSRPNFESLARKYRFQALGKACRDLGINSLLLAHHEDDQAETVLMRMINGHRMQGLMGIKGCSEIPECYGIHGVHESGGIDDRSSRDSLNITQSPSGRNPVSQLRTETGGAKVYRPLLGFNKTRLIATCQALDIEWFEDLTNKDPTLTTRNAIRHMYNSHAMPASLSKTSILALSDRFKEKAESQQNEMNSWLAQSKITRFETRSGILGIRFPGLSHLRSSSGEGTGRDYEQVAAGLLRRVIMLVTPEENVHLSTLHGAAKHLFAELFMDHEVHYQPTKFTVTGVQFDPIKTSDGRYAKPEWLLSRQPHSSPPSSRPLILIPPCTSISTSRPSNPLWTPWTFYDNRYWIRLQNLTLTTLLIRPFSKDDLKPFQESLPKADRDRLRSIFKEIAPGDVRWTLPAVVMRGRYGCEKVQCLPTLDVCRVEAGRMVKWEVRYKKVDVAELPMP